MSVSEVVDPFGAGLREFLAALRQFRKIPEAVAQQTALATVRVAVIGNSTEEYLTDAIELALAPRLRCVRYCGQFDQWPQELLDARSGLARFGPDVVVLHLASLGFTAGGTRFTAVPAELIREALAAFAGRSSAPLVAILPEPLPEATGGDDESGRWYGAAREAVARAVTAALPGRSATIDPLPALVDLARPWQAQAYWGSAKLPYHPMGCVAVGRRVAAAIENITYPRIKAVAVDCDDTLWAGLVGEAGAEGVGLSPFDGDSGHLRLQRLLKEASSHGILLVAVSKNELANVEEVFRLRAGEMILTADDFAAFRVGWGPKSDALREIARELRLGLDAFMFLDDSPFERGEVRANAPEVFVPELPSNPDDYAPFVARLGVLERPIVTDEDRKRTELYRHERVREEARVRASSSEDYLASLEIELIAAPIAAGPALDRIAQLVAKTNQFNVTTRRYGRDELTALAADPATYAYSFRVRDRFGDAGLIGVAIAKPFGPGEAVLDAFLMSCRVMGRTIEEAMFEHLSAWHRGRGVSRLHAEYVPTAKNALVAELLPRLGFVSGVFDLAAAPSTERRFVAIREAE